jgi:Ca2+-binding RTX toxin-like protein
MALASEAVTAAGSGLVFINDYGPSVSAAYRSAILGAEHELQSHFTNQVTIGVSFDLQPLDPQTAATNSFNVVGVSYGALANALRTHAADSTETLAANGLPAADPSNGAGFMLALGQANILGLAPQTNAFNVTITLNSNLNWSFGQDAIGAIEHEITEGGFGRNASLGISDSRWAPLDLFRFTASGARDYTGGSDGVPTFFGIDSAHVSALPFHNGVNRFGVFDGQDLGDWAFNVSGDTFGAGGPGAPGSLSPTDLQVLEVLGWNDNPFNPAPETLATSLTDTSHPFGQLAVGGAATGSLNQAGAREWFQVTLQAGHTYTIQMLGQPDADGTLADPYLRLHDFAGNLLAANDDISVSNPDSSIAFAAPASGTYYVEAGASLDGYAGSYTLQLDANGTAAQDISTAGNDVLNGAAGGGASIDGGTGADTITGFGGGNTLYGGVGRDLITGGSGFDQINGNQGADTIIGRSQTGDWLLGGRGNDSIDASASSGSNIINGNVGNDTLVGGTGADSLHGGQGDDQIHAGSGGDWLSGDLGHNTLTGGAGADTFHAGAGQDLVIGFDASHGDRVQVDAGVQFTATQVAGDVHVDLAGGGEMILQNTQLTSLPDGWIVS